MERARVEREEHFYESIKYEVSLHFLKFLPHIVCRPTYHGANNHARFWTSRL